MTDKQPEALRLADTLDRAINQTNPEDNVIHVARWFLEDSAAELRRLHEVNQELLEGLKDLLNRDEKNTCQHETTHRGGAIWEICDDCGSQWADDRGGKPKWKDPQEWVNARAAIAKGEQP